MTSKGLKLTHVNTRSIFRKITLLAELYQCSDFLCCTETWLDSRISNNLVKIGNMKIVRCDRKNNTADYNTHIVGGGVCIYVSEKWSDFCTVIPEGTQISKDFEMISIEIIKPKFEKIFIACFYKPPKGSIEECLKFLETLVNKYKRKKFEIWILGNFNVDMLRRDDINTVRITRF